MKKYIIKRNECGFMRDYVFFSMEDAEARVLEYNKYHDERNEEREQLPIVVEEENLTPYLKEILLPESITIDGIEHPLELEEVAGRLVEPRVYVTYHEQRIDLSLALAYLDIYIERWNEWQTLKNDCWRGMNKYLVHNSIFRRISINIETGLWKIELPFTTSASLDTRVVHSEWFRVERSPRGGYMLRSISDSFIGMCIYF